MVSAAGPQLDNLSSSGYIGTTEHLENFERTDGHRGPLYGCNRPRGTLP